MNFSQISNFFLFSRKKIAQLICILALLIAGFSIFIYLQNSSLAEKTIISSSLKTFEVSQNPSSEPVGLDTLRKFIFKKKIAVNNPQVINRTPPLDFAEEFKINTYKNAVLEHFKICVKISFNKAPISLKELLAIHSRNVSFFVEIDKAGFIKSLVLTSSSGVSFVDDFIASTIKDMCPFPPIPNYLNRNSFVISELSCH